MMKDIYVNTEKECYGCLAETEGKCNKCGNTWLCDECKKEDESGQGACSLCRDFDYDKYMRGGE